MASIRATGSGISTPYQALSQARICAISRDWSAMIARARSLSSGCTALASTGRAISTAMAWCTAIAWSHARSKASPESCSSGGCIGPIWAAAGISGLSSAPRPRASARPAPSSSGLRMESTSAGLPDLVLYASQRCTRRGFLPRRPPFRDAARPGSHVEVAHVAGVGLDELAARRHRVAHQHVEDRVGRHGVLDIHLQDRARGGVHSGLPELLGVHLPQALVALDGDLLVAVALLELLD